MIGVPIYYLEVNILCIIILLTILEKVHDENMTLKTEITYQNLLISTIFLAVSDLVVGVFRGTMFPVSKMIVTLSNSLCFVFGTLIGYFFNEYIRIRTNFYKDKKKRIISVFPIILVVALLILNVFNHCIFFIDEYNLYHRGNYLILYYLISYTYFGSIIVTLAMALKKEEVDKKEFKRLIFFILIPIITIFIESLNCEITLTGVGFTIAILMIFLDGVKSVSTIDELTEINNRRAFNIYASKLFSDSNNKMFLMVMDVNDFKKINDEYGHLTGDKVLKNIALMLKRAVKKTDDNFFLARFGGDEFIIVGKVISDDTIEKLISNIHQEEELANKNANCSYEIILSIGYAIKKDTHVSVDDLIEEADVNMYMNKKELKKKSKKAA